MDILNCIMTSYNFEPDRTANTTVMEVVQTEIQFLRVKMFVTQI